LDVKQDLDRILFSAQEIERAVDALAERVTDTLADRPVTVIGVLKGSCIFCADLVRRLPFPLELGFAAASSYGAETNPGPLELHYFPSADEVSGRDVLLVDDILDSGRTLQRLRVELVERGAASVRTCVLLDKPARRAVALEADFRCFEVEDVFVVGYGLDFGGRYRNLPFVAELGRAVTGAPARDGTGGGPGASR
jgi:hypoxanthine phosphoribosyltransferase